MRKVKLTLSMLFSLLFESLGQKKSNMLKVIFSKFHVSPDQAPKFKGILTCTQMKQLLHVYPWGSESCILITVLESIGHVMHNNAV